MALVGRRIEVRGVVQGVGFRPWVYRLAQEFGVKGQVWNDSSGVTIEAFATRPVLDAFLEKLHQTTPPAASIQDLAWVEIVAQPLTRFSIVESGTTADRNVSIPPDLATCPDCLAEIFDPLDRRYRYPFTNCTNCGPRFTISLDVPYDRPSTTMAHFIMCADCQSEYDNPADRRFHAQPNACPVCGPKLRAITPTGLEINSTDPIAVAARALNAQLIVAIKGIGGYHLACDATSDQAVHRLRERKHRDAKPFAVMVRDLEAARQLAVLGPEEEKLLTLVERPVVLVQRRAGTQLADEIAPSNPLVGLLLPYAPLHHILLAAVGRPLVMTSGNLAEEPMAYRDEEAIERLGDIADLFLIHNREIAVRVDDSVARVIAGKPVVFRRARGYVPRSIKLPRPVEQPILACGAHLKNTFCLAFGDRAFLGPHIGDLENLETLRAFEDGIERMKKFLGVTPAAVAHDLHPEYLSTRYAESIDDLPRVGVQHHHAHVASAMAEHQLEGPVIGVAYDGTGFGTDETAWGGEILVGGYENYERAATFRPIRLAGSHAAIRQVWRIALAMLDDAFDGEPPLHLLPLFREIPRRGVDVVRRLIDQKLNAPLARGVGRYFDAFGAIILNRQDSLYEGQVALEWNLAADLAERGRYSFDIDSSRAPREIDFRPVVRAAVEDLLAGRSPATISARFHNTLASATADMVHETAIRRGSLPVVLTGGCFQNALLAERIVDLIGSSFRVYLHGQVPPGDGGIALGQAVIAAAQLRKPREWMTTMAAGDFAGVTSAMTPDKKKE